MCSRLREAYISIACVSVWQRNIEAALRGGVYRVVLGGWACSRLREAASGKLV